MDKKFCVHCGAEVNPHAVVCIHCGCSLTGVQYTAKSTSDGSSEFEEIMRVLIKVFAIIGIVSQAFLIIPLIWCIPMYKKINGYLKGEEDLTTGFKICVLLFVNLIAGILLLVDEK